MWVGEQAPKYDFSKIYIQNYKNQKFLGRVRWVRWVRWVRQLVEASNGINIFFSGPDDTSPKLTELCEKRIQNVNVTSMGNHMFVRFKSDASIRGKGFTASYTSSNGGCGGRMIGKFE